MGHNRIPSENKNPENNPQKEKKNPTLDLKSPPIRATFRQGSKTKLRSSNPWVLYSRTPICFQMSPNWVPRDLDPDLKKAQFFRALGKVWWTSQKGSPLECAHNKAHKFAVQLQCKRERERERERKEREKRERKVRVLCFCLPSRERSR